jgi:hypothetical protein
VLGVASLAGCAGLFETRSVGAAPPLVENRPDAVYTPTHVEGMEMAGTGRRGDYRVAVMYSYPHRFWTVERDGDRLSTAQVEVAPADDVHLMASVWDPETGRVLPDTGLSVEVVRDGDLVTQETIYQMLSMRMGYHHGANFELDGDGTYTVNVSIGGTGIRRMGAFEGRFGESVTVPVEFEYSQATRDEIPFERLDDAGEPGAAEPRAMEMMPNATVPATERVPGRVLGEATSGDARFVASRLDVAGEPYLAVWAATPYNRLLIPNMRLSASGAGELAPTLHPDLGYHYGARVDDAGRPVTVSVDSPPFVARHEGYETAFLDMDPMTFEG